jgi:hypothetical protein
MFQDLSQGRALAPVVRRTVAADDVGRAINPVLIDGPIHGGIDQGIGMAFMEAHHSGRTDNLHDYLIPTIGDVPGIEGILRGPGARRPVTSSAHHPRRSPAGLRFTTQPASRSPAADRQDVHRSQRTGQPRASGEPSPRRLGPPREAGRRGCFEEPPADGDHPDVRNG